MDFVMFKFLTIKKIIFMDFVIFTNAKLFILKSLSFIYHKFYHIYASGNFSTILELKHQILSLEFANNYFSINYNI